MWMRVSREVMEWACDPTEPHARNLGYLTRQLDERGKVQIMHGNQDQHISHLYV